MLLRTVFGCCCRDQGDELQHLKLLQADLQRELEILKARSESISTLKSEVHHLGHQILQERSKVKVLSKELESPLNVHRCSILPPTQRRSEYQG